ncbi:hypothetical protein [Micromonospora sp. NPDC048063]|uniref:hypothetical protein n=1 Tax=Micromonospora sp. NPDC048063 TaxID=3364256 RepID=UPI0037172FFF
MLKRWLSTGESGPAASHGEAEEQKDRRKSYLAECAKIRQVWDRTVGSPRGLLPGATLDPALTPQGWYGHVQGTITQTDALYGSGERKALARAVENAYELPPGAVLIGDSWTGVPDSVALWAYSRPGEVDYYERLPHTVFGKEWADKEPVPGQLTDLERSELRDWTRKHLSMLKVLRSGGHVDMEQVNRRYNRMRGAILDALTRASVEQVRDMVVDCGLDYLTAGEDVGRRLGLPHPRRP